MGPDNAWVTGPGPVEGKLGDQKPGEGIPLPGKPANLAVQEWAIEKVIDYRRSAGLNTAIVNDLENETVCVEFRVAPGGGNALALVIDADTEHGGHFQQVIPWSPVFATAIIVQIVQRAGGVVHA
jgi:hypothetical protein